MPDRGPEAALLSTGSMRKRIESVVGSNSRTFPFCLSAANADTRARSLSGEGLRMGEIFARQTDCRRLAFYSLRQAVRLLSRARLLLTSSC